MNDNSELEQAIQELRGENEALRRALVIVIDSLPDRYVIQGAIGNFGRDGEGEHPRKRAYLETINWLVRHIGR